VCVWRVCVCVWCVCVCVFARELALICSREENISSKYALAQTKPRACLCVCVCVCACVRAGGRSVLYVTYPTDRLSETKEEEEEVLVIPLCLLYLYAKPQMLAPYQGVVCSEGPRC
jgi:hypothetical protein